MSIINNFDKSYQDYIRRYQKENNCIFVGCLESDYSLVFRMSDTSLEVVDTFPDGHEVILFKDYCNI